MKKISVCYVLTSNPKKSIGGTPLVVNELMKYSESGFICRCMFGFFMPFFSPFLTALKLIRNRHDIINIQDMEGYAYALLPRFLRKKVVYTAHGTWRKYFEAYPPRGFYGRIKAIIAERMQKTIIKRSDFIIAVAEHIKDEITGFYGVSQDKITVIHNGVDTERFRPAYRKPKNVAIWVGDDPDLKGLDTAINYAKQYNMKLIVVGVNGENTDNAEYLGKIPPEKMPEIYNKANLLVFFSKSEGHPLVPLEAMACGLDIIASKESNIEIMPISKDGLYRINGKKARKIAEGHDWKKQAEKYIKVYERLLSGDRK